MMIFQFSKNAILRLLGLSPGFSGHFPGHFAALRAKAMTRRALLCECSRVIRARCWASFPTNFSGPFGDFQENFLNLMCSFDASAQSENSSEFILYQ